MIFGNPKEVERAKKMALAAYTDWKVAQLLPHIRRWAEEGCSEAEIDRRLEDFKDEVQTEAARTLRLVTLAALKEGAFP